MFIKRAVSNFDVISFCPLCSKPCDVCVCKKAQAQEKEPILDSNITQEKPVNKEQQGNNNNVH